MNLNKFTKAELISKFKKLEHKNDSNNNRNTFLNQIKNYLSQILDLILTFKNILIKITMISFFIKIFTKYRIFRRFWFMLNSIVMAIFGMSLMDNFGLDFLNNFFMELKIVLGNTVDYLTNSRFYSYLNKLFTNEVPTSEKTIDNKRTMIEENKTNTTRNEYPNGQNQRNSKISDWLKPEEKIEADVIEETSYKKYYITAGVIVVASLSWYYFPEIKDGIISAWEWFSSNARGPGGAAGGETGDQHNSEHDNTMIIPKNMRLDNNGEVRLSEKIEQELSSTPLKSEGSVEIPKARDDLNIIDQSGLFKEIEDAVEMVDKGKNKILSPSASLENLNEQAIESWERSLSPSSSSSSSNSSDSTIKPIVEPVLNNPSSGSSNEAIPSSSTLPSTSSLSLNKVGEGKNLADNVIMGFVDNNWRKVIDVRVNDSINFIENHMPKNELDETEYIEETIKLIKKINVESTEKLKIDIQEKKLDFNEIRIQRGVITKVELWVDKIEEELSNLENE